MSIHAPPREPKAWARLGALAFAVAALGLPVNHAAGYGLLMLAGIVVFSMPVRTAPARWLAAAAVVLLAWLAQALIAAPKIEEGHNVFLADGARTPLARHLPEDVYRVLQAEFDRLYPAERRCDPNLPGCWRAHGFPDRAFAFAADGIWDRTEFSRRVSGIDFANPVWLRLGFTNDLRYPWFPVNSDIQRLSRDGRAWKGFDRWRLLMPWYVAFRFPSDFVGSQLCWTGSVLWEGAGARFSLWRHPAPACRTLAPEDVGRRIFGVAIVPNSLSMQLTPPLTLQLRQSADAGIRVVAVLAVVMLLAGAPGRRVLLPALLIGLGLIVVVIDDASFLLGFRPHDGGDDGLVYEGMARRIVQHLLDGDIALALKGEEAVFFYGGPGLRYLRALERFVFGDSNLGYLTLVLLLPLAVFALFRRFLSPRWALALVLMFLAVPVGALFGTTFYQYVTFAARGYADPAAYVLFVCGLLPIVGMTGGDPDDRFWPAFSGALLLALAVFVRPNIALLAGVLMTGVGLAAMSQWQLRRLAGLCLGFSLVLFMPLHNWLFGGVFVLFSTNADHPQVLLMPPSAYAAALGDLLRFDFEGGHVIRMLRHLLGWLSGPSGSYLFVPVHAATIIVLVHVAVRGRRYDRWLRLIALASLAQQAFGLFYIHTERYYLLTWLVSFLVTAVWARSEGFPWLQARAPDLGARVMGSGLVRRLDAGLAALQRRLALPS